jgi:hypothetical protein
MISILLKFRSLASVIFVLIQSLLFSVVNHGTNKEFHQTNKMMAYFKVFSLFCLCVICSSFSSAQQFWFKFRRFPPAMNGNKTLGTPQEKIAYQPRTTESMLARTYSHRLAIPHISFYNNRNIEPHQHHLPPRASKVPTLTEASLNTCSKVPTLVEASLSTCKVENGQRQGRR